VPLPQIRDCAYHGLEAEEKDHDEAVVDISQHRPLASEARGCLRRRRDGLNDIKEGRHTKITKGR